MLTYADKLWYRLKWAYEAAQKNIDKESNHQKAYYDKNFKCAILHEGDLVMIRVVKPGTDYKFADKWEQDPWEILAKCPNTPVYSLKNTRMGEVKELHRNLLYPLRLVNPIDNHTQMVTLPVSTNEARAVQSIKLKQIQVIMDEYFACHCRNCVGTV